MSLGGSIDWNLSFLSLIMILIGPDFSVTCLRCIRSCMIPKKAINEQDGLIRLEIQSIFEMIGRYL